MKRHTWLGTQTLLRVDDGLVPAGVQGGGSGAGVQDGGGRDAHWTPWLPPQLVRCCWGWACFLVRFSNMDLQTMFRLEDFITLTTLKEMSLRPERKI